MIPLACPAALTLLAMMADDPPAMYLSVSEAGGTEFQLDPDSPALRAAIKRRLERPDDLLDARALAEDLLFLRRGLRKIYSGYPELLQSASFDVEAHFDQQVAKLRAGPAQVKFGESALPFFRELKRSINDGHFAMSGWDPDPKDRYVEYQTITSDRAPSLTGCTAPQGAPSTLRVAHVVTADGRRGQLVTISARSQGPTIELDCSGGRRLTLTARPPAPREEDQSEKPAYEWRRVGDTAIIRVRRFMGTPADEALLASIAKDYPEHRRASVIVFDLRGNTGGSDSHTYRWISEAKRGTWSSDGWALYPPGANLPWQKWNYEVWSSIDQNRADDPASIAGRKKLRAEFPRSPAELAPSVQTDTAHDKAKLPYKGRVFVLVNSRCGSSGESSAQALQAALGAPLVGERTRGNLEFGNNRFFVLPRTGLRFFFSTKRNYFSTPVESVGVPTDVYLVPELMGKPVEELVPFLKKLPRRTAGSPTP